MDTSAPMEKYETLWHQIHSAEMSWVRSVLGPKFPYTTEVCCYEVLSTYKGSCSLKTYFCTQWCLATVSNHSAMTLFLFVCYHGGREVHVRTLISMWNGCADIATKMAYNSARKILAPSGWNQVDLVVLQKNNCWGNAVATHRTFSNAIFHLSKLV